jgi:uncharacterized protein YjbI with pentapeptide repeats
MGAGGCRGEGRLDLVGADAREAGLGSSLLTRARLARVRLARARMDAVQLDGAELIEIEANEADLTSVSLIDGSLRGGSFVRVSMQPDETLRVIYLLRHDGTSLAVSSWERSEEPAFELVYLLLHD